MTNLVPALFAIGFAAIALLQGSRAHAGQPARGPAVVELFTSEGCSSCPPAEAVLTALSSREDVLTLAFHVTYWDGLGWRDRFGLQEAAIRQQRYVSWLHLSGAYTPQAIVNGRVDVLGSDRASLERMVGNLPRPAAIGLRQSGGAVSVTLPQQLADGCPCEILLLGVRPDAATAVGGGENRGRTLRASSIVRSITHAGSWMGGVEQRDLSLSAVPEDAGSLVVVAQRIRDGVVTAAGRITLAARKS